MSLETSPRRTNPTTIAAAGAVLALAGGILTGVSLPKAAPAECEQALDYAEQGLGQSANGLEAMSRAMGGDWGRMMRAEQELNDVTAELNRLTPLYRDAKEACLR